MRLWALLFGCVAATVSGCDSGPDRTPASTFLSEQPGGRSIFGEVLQGTEPVAGALVLVDASPGLTGDALLATTSDPSVFPRSVSTNPDGLYRVQFAPVGYDLSVRHDRQVFVFRELGERFFQPPLGADVPVRGFHARVVSTTVPPPQSGNAVAYFVSGADARAATSTDAQSVDVTFRRFDATVTLQAVEYVASRGLAAAVAAGTIDLRVVDGTVVSAAVPMQPVALKVVVTFDAAPPLGYALGPLEVEMDLGLRTSSHTVAQVAPGKPVEITLVPNARYAVRGIATKGGAVSSSGRLIFDPFAGRVPLFLPAPVPALAPIDDAAPSAPSPPETVPQAILDPQGPLAVRFATGVVEHALAPVSGDGASIHVVTSARTTALPDVTRFGLARATGRYTWTVEHFATLERTDLLTGEDGRVTPPSWKSAPRIIVLR